MALVPAAEVDVETASRRTIQLLHIKRPRKQKRIGNLNPSQYALG